MILTVSSLEASKATLGKEEGRKLYPIPPFSILVLKSKKNFLGWASILSKGDFSWEEGRIQPKKYYKLFRTHEKLHCKGKP